MRQSPDTQRPVTQPQSSGVGLVIGLVALGCCLGGFAVWFQWQQTRRCLEFYGPHVASAISLAPRVEIWQLEPAGGPRRLRVLRRIDASGAAGLVHLRRGLVEDGNFTWSAAESGDRPEVGDRPPPSGRHLPADWRLAIAFFPDAEEPPPTAVIALAIDSQGRGVATVPGRPGRVTLGRIGSGLRTWLEATLAAADAALPPGTTDGPDGRREPGKDR